MTPDKAVQNAQVPRVVASRSCGVTRAMMAIELHGEAGEKPGVQALGHHEQRERRCGRGQQRSAGRTGSRHDKDAVVAESVGEATGLEKDRGADDPDDRQKPRGGGGVAVGEPCPMAGKIKNAEVASRPATNPDKNAALSRRLATSAGACASVTHTCLLFLTPSRGVGHTAAQLYTPPGARLRGANDIDLGQAARAEVGDRALAELEVVAEVERLQRRVGRRHVVRRRTREQEVRERHARAERCRRRRPRP